MRMCWLDFKIMIYQMKKSMNLFSTYLKGTLKAMALNLILTAQREEICTTNSMILITKITIESQLRI
jgi:hypothetical protein